MLPLVSRSAWAVGVPAGVNLAQQLSSSHIGAISIGIFASLFTFGVVSFQAWSYWQSFPNDALPFKTLAWSLVGINMYVLLLYMLSVGQNGLRFAAVVRCIFEYQGFVNNFGNWAWIGNTQWTLTIEWVITALAALLTQTFYAWRVYRLLGTLVIPCIIITLSSLSLPFAIAMFILRQQAGSAFPNPDAVNKITWALAVAQTLSAAADLAIFISMLIGLWRISSLPLVTWRHKQIRRVLHLTFDTQLVTTAFSISVVALYHSGWREIAGCLNTQLPRLYLFSTFLSLLARRNRPYHFEGADTLDRGNGKPWLPKLRPQKDGEKGEEKEAQEEDAKDDEPIDILSFLGVATHTENVLVNDHEDPAGTRRSQKVEFRGTGSDWPSEFVEGEVGGTLLHSM